ncbi:hypothetical protein KIH74_10730 [Kineosporia sp. J2-2]|uniref:Uncharacterized protein n=1 Tax=Kineosporia corallincola TaxID=2835133 RepID=A0ABS5TEA1_9ACTN|nr:hypothetical protein [Kineosporia corallincola]MBT0769396.1 hypothetical protein [Kineosporia corallincola]
MSLILTAVVAGESKADSSTMQSEVADDFTSLRSALHDRLAGQAEAQTALEDYIARPEEHRDTLIEGLRQTGATQDPDVLRLALKVMQRIDPEGSANGNYVLDPV